MPRLDSGIIGLNVQQVLRDARERMQNTRHCNRQNASLCENSTWPLTTFLPINPPEDRIFGSGQGSGGSPPLWLVVITTMFRALVRLHREGMKFLNPKRKKEQSTKLLIKVYSALQHQSCVKTAAITLTAYHSPGHD